MLNLNVTLPNDTTRIAFDLPFDIGVFDISVSSYVNDRPCAKFIIAKSCITNPGTVTRLVLSRGQNSSQIDIEWPSNSLPQLFYRQAPNDSQDPATYNLTIN